MYKDIWFCRWCGHIYRPLEETYRDGFCKPACKQAHYRAYKKYVTGLATNRAGTISREVTQSKSGGRRGMIKSKVL